MYSVSCHCNILSTPAWFRTPEFLHISLIFSKGCDYCQLFPKAVKITKPLVNKQGIMFLCKSPSNTDRNTETHVVTNLDVIEAALQAVVRRLNSFDDIFFHLHDKVIRSWKHFVSTIKTE